MHGLCGHFGSRHRPWANQKQQHSPSLYAFACSQVSGLYYLSRQVLARLRGPCLCLFLAMALSDHARSIMSQAGFVPPEQMESWAETDYTLGPVAHWLGTKPETLSAVATAAGFTEQAHVSAVTGITMEEWEGMIQGPSSFTFRLTLAMHGAATPARDSMSMRHEVESPSSGRCRRDRAYYHEHHSHRTTTTR